MVRKKMMVILAAVVALVVGTVGDAWADDSRDFIQRLSLAKDRYFLVNDEVRGAVESIADLIDDDVVAWVASMYDPESGGFYYARSAIGREGFGADIESTAQALRFIEHMGAFPAMPSEIKEKFIHFFQSRQDPASGYFYDPQFGSDVSDAKRSRNLGQAVGYLEKLGAYPLYPLPYDAERTAVSPTSGPTSFHASGRADRAPKFTGVGTHSSGRPGRFPQATTGGSLKKASVNRAVTATSSDTGMGERPGSGSPGSSHLPEYLTSEQALRRWMESFDWDHKPWNAGHNVSSARREIVALGLEDVVYEFIEEKQNPDTGLWGIGRTYEEVSGAMKLSSYYRTRPYPHAEKMLESTLYAVEYHRPGNASQMRNPLDLISSAIINGAVGYDREMEAMLLEKLPLVIHRTKDHLLTLKQADGGFSYSTRGSAARSQGATVSLGWPEGDMNALMSGVHASVVFVYNMTGLPKPSLPRKADVEAFWDTIVHMEPHPPIVEVAGLDEDFQGDPSDLSWQVESKPDIGTYDIVVDPHDNDNKVMRITKFLAGENSRISAQFSPAGEGADKTSITFKFMFEAFDSSGAVDIHFGTDTNLSHRALSYMLGKKSGGTYYMSHRTTTSGSRGTMISELEPDVWYELEIDYEPRGMTDMTVTISLNDQQLVTDTYYNHGDETKGPVPDIGYMVFQGFKAWTGTLYIDDVRVSTE